MRILSWNIQWGRGVDGCVDLERIAAVIRQHQADVVCLQEVARHHPGLPGMTRGDADQPARLQALLPGHEAAFACGSDLPDGSGGRRQFGQLVLSRRPLLQVFRHQLPFPSDPSVPAMPRVALEVGVDGDDGPLRVVTTHLEYYSARQRAAQIEALRTLQAEGHRHAVAPRSAAEVDPPYAVLPRGEFAVFCGDFNAPAGAPEHRRLQEGIAPDVPRLVDAWAALHPGALAAPNFSPARMPSFGVHDRRYLAMPATYDFCYVSENLAGCVVALEVDATCQASDHQPVLLVLN